MGEASDLDLDSAFLPYGRQSIADDDVQAVVDALRSDFLTTGPTVERFERSLAKACGAKHAIVVANGTAALHIAMLAAGIKPGDRVLTSPITFLASANCAEFVGATADFADIDPRTYNVTAETLDRAWREDVRAVVAVDFAGQPCEMPEIASLARGRKAIVVEDACHGIGSQFEHQGQRHPVGGHPWADLTVFSFHPVKTVTTGEGGAILTGDDALSDRCRLLRNHGMVNPPQGLSGPGAAACSKQGPAESAPLETGPWYYEMRELGYNYRLTDLQCALGLSQMKKLDRFRERRGEIVAAYNEAFRGWPLVTTPHVSPAALPAWHLYVLQIDFAKSGRTRTQVMDGLRSRGIGSQVHYIPVHLQPYYRTRHGYAPGKCPVAEEYYRRCLSLPLYPSMTDRDVRRVIEAVSQTVGLC